MKNSSILCSCNVEWLCDILSDCVAHNHYYLVIKLVICNLRVFWVTDWQLCVQCSDYSVIKCNKNNWNFICERVKCGKLTGTDNQEKTNKGKCARGFTASFESPSKKSVNSSLCMACGSIGVRKGVRLFINLNLGLNKNFRFQPPSAQCPTMCRNTSTIIAKHSECFWKTSSE